METLIGDDSQHGDESTGGRSMADSDLSAAYGRLKYSKNTRSVGGIKQGRRGGAKMVKLPYGWPSYVLEP